MACLAHLGIMSVGKLLRELLCVVAGEDIAQAALHDERRAAYLLGLPEALLESLTLRLAVSQALPHAQIRLSGPFPAGVLAEVVQYAAPQETGIAAGIELHGFLNDLLQRIQLCGCGNKIHNSSSALRQHGGPGIHQDQSGKPVAVVKGIVEG